MRRFLGLRVVAGSRGRPVVDALDAPLKPLKALLQRIELLGHAVHFSVLLGDVCIYARDGALEVADGFFRSHDWF